MRGFLKRLRWLFFGTEIKIENKQEKSFIELFNSINDKDIWDHFYKTTSSTNILQDQDVH